MLLFTDLCVESICERIACLFAELIKLTIIMMTSTWRLVMDDLTPERHKDDKPTRFYYDGKYREVSY